MQVAKWPSQVFRAFAIANFLLAAVGLFFLSSSVLVIGAGKIGNTSAEPYFLWAFWTMATTNFILLGLLVLGGIRLLQLKTEGVVICNGVFVAEIGYFMALGFLWSAAFPPSLSISIAAATGVGSMGLSPQLICGYPLVALVCLNLARPRLNVTGQIVESA